MPTQEELERMQREREQQLQAQQAQTAAAAQDYMRAVNTNTEDLAAELSQSGEAADRAGQKYYETIGDWVTDQQNELARQREAAARQEKSDYNTRVFGGLTEGLAALVNMVGVTQGATPQQWQSPQQEWAQRADALRRERDAKIETNRGILRNLEAQKAQVGYSNAAGAAERKMRNASAIAGRRDQVAKMGFDAAIARINTQAAAGKELSEFQKWQLQFMENARNNAAGRNIQQQNADNTRAYHEGMLRLQGYDPATGKFANSKTGKFDRDTPDPRMSSRRGTSRITSAGQLQDEVLNGEKVGQLRDILAGMIKDGAGNSVFADYNDYTSPSKRHRRQNNDTKISENAQYEKHESVDRNADFNDIRDVLDILSEPTAITAKQAQQLMQSPAFYKAMQQLGYDMGEISGAGLQSIDDEFSTQ